MSAENWQFSTYNFKEHRYKPALLPGNIYLENLQINMLKCLDIIEPACFLFMTEKFRNKYRIPSARLQSWDYSWNAAYFITICTHNRQNFFGRIADEKMQLSEIGKITHHFWNEIPNHFPYIQLGEFIAMPNHIHGIIIIDNNVQTPKLGVSSANSERANSERANPPNFSKNGGNGTENESDKKHKFRREK